MIEFGLKSKSSGLETQGVNKFNAAPWNLSPAELTEHAVINGEGFLTDTGALMCDTGVFTGRSPKDRFVVEDEKTKDTVWWGAVNIPISSEKFDAIHQKMIDFLADKKLYIRDAYA